MTIAITPLPTPPTRVDPDNFADRADAFLGALPTFATQMNTLGNEVQVLGNAAETAAVVAQASRLAAESASAASMWDAGTNYAIGVAAISPTDYQAYRRESPGGVDGTDPAASASWTLVGGKFATRASPSISGSLTLETGFSRPATTISAGAYMGDTPSNSSALGATRPVFMNKDVGATMVGAIGNGLGQPSGFWGALAGEAQWGGLLFKGNGVELTSGYSNNIGSAGPIRFMFKGSERANMDYRGILFCAGLAGKQGISSAGGYSGTALNLWYTGAAVQIWANDTNLGNLTISSDYRVKKSVQPITDPAMARIMKLRPVSYEYADNEQLNFKADGVAREGFIAHELAEVIPSAVEGEMDAPNQIQSLRLDPIIAILTKGLQELSAEVSALRAEVAALRGDA